MVQKTNSFERLWKELKRRKVVHVITVYAAASFVILQLVNMVARPLQLPDWTEALVIVLLCIGFVIAALLSWVYDITPAGVKKTKRTSAAKHADQSNHTVSIGWKIATYIGAAIIVSLVAINFFNKRHLIGDISIPEKTIAVLPFYNDGPQTEDASYIGGIMSEILDNLSTIQELSVRPRTSVEKFRTSPRPPISQISKELNVNYIVDGSGQKIGNTIRLSVQLINAVEDKLLWTKQYVKNLNDANDIFSIQSQIAQAIASKIKATITPEEKKIIEKAGTTNLTAYYLYQKGRDEHLNYRLNPGKSEALLNAKKFYSEAVKCDSTFAQAYAGLALLEMDKNDVWRNLFSSDYFSSFYLDSTIILVDRALFFDPNLAEAYYVKGLYYWLKGKEEKVLENLDRALEYNPNYWMAYEFKGWYYYVWSRKDYDYFKAIENLKNAISINHGREYPSLLYALGNVYSIIAGFPEEGRKCFNQALMLNGDSAEYFNNLGSVDLNLTNYDNSLRYYKRAFKIDSTNNGIIQNIGDVYAYLGRYKESLKYISKYADWLMTNQIHSSSYSHRIGYIFALNGYSKEADYWFKEQEDFCIQSIKSQRFAGQIGLTACYDLAGVYAFKGDKTRAYENLRTWAKLSVYPLWWVSLVKKDPLFNNIRREPEFQNIIREVDAKYQTEHERVRKLLEEQGMLDK